MEVDESLDVKGLELEERQLRLCRWGFLLLGAALFFQVLIAFLPVLLEGSEGNPTPAPYPVVETIVWNAFLPLTLLPGAIVLLTQARSKRWRWSAVGLVGIVFVESAVAGAIGGLRDPTLGPEQPQPFVVRVLDHAGALVGWLELWWIAVAVAEFSMASRAGALLEQTESLGSTILLGVVLRVLFAGWTLPVTPSLDSPPDALSVVLMLAYILVSVIAFVWTLHLLANSATLARLLARKCAELSRNHH